MPVSADYQMIQKEGKAMKKRIPILTCFLVLILAVGAVLPACKKKEVPPKESSESMATIEGDLFVPDDLPDRLPINHEKTKILGWEFTPNEFADSASSDTIDEALWQRVAHVESRLQTTLDIKLTPGSNDHLDNFKSTVENSLHSGIGYDIIMQYSGFALIGATSGYYLDITDYPYVNFDKPWWPGNLQECITINDSAYFVSGDISVNCVEGMFAILVNNDILRDYLFEDDPYQLASDGNWTLDKMMGMANEVYTDLDSSGGKSEEDEFGFVFINMVSIDAFLEGSDIQMVQRKNDGTLETDSGFVGEKTENLIDKLTGFISSDSVYVNTKYAAIFPEGRAMFMVGKLDTLIYWMKESKFSFGVLPIPKYDLSQTGYKTTVNFNYSMFSIPKTAQDPAMMSAVLEALASEGYRTVNPAVFETAFKFQYSESRTVSEMFDLILAGRSFDVGRLTMHQMESNGLPSMVASFRNITAGGTGAWGTVAPTYKKIWNGFLEKLPEQLKEKENNS